MATNGNKNSRKTLAENRCEICNYVTVKKNNYEKHLLTPKHIKATNGNKNSQKTLAENRCEICNYVTVRKTDYAKHLLTPKHIKATNNKNSQKSCIYECDNCNKIYQTYSGLSKHKKKCFQQEKNHIITPEMILTIIQQNQEIKDLLLEQNKIIMGLSKNNNIG